ncbi:group II intron reverse transcriptase/maturase [Roseiconus lacunae]|uniref:group II intron reverse transcriptase/maturase n=1 Tax=Roseiconus lacunae TaxID=2605694 RepID=UPI00331598BD
MIHRSLIEAIVDEANIERAWKQVKANRGAPGPDGITLDKFFETFRHHWPVVRQQLLEGTYRPGPCRRKSIPKPNGGERHLGIPNVVDRLIQQAILQVLTPIFDPSFSESSFGFRHGRSAHGATQQIQRTIRSGYRWCVDMDLSKFFDRVQHDVLMTRVSRRVRDRRLLKLIGRFLRAGVMADGLLQPSTEGTMQGGPLSPLLANILLDDFDKVLEARGLRFVRYADDFLIFVRSELSAWRVFRSVERYLTGVLKLAIHRDKSRVRETAGVEFLGYQFHGFAGQIRVSPTSVKKMRQRCKDILRRSRGCSMRRRLRDLRLYLRGWLSYFALEQRRTQMIVLDKWLRRRVRACYWNNWRLPRTRLRKLSALGVPPAEAYPFAHSGKGPWRLSMTSGVQRALTNEWLTAQGLFGLADRWTELAPKRRTA